MFLKAPGSLGGSELMEQFPNKDPARYFCDDEEVFHAHDATYSLSNQWGSTTEEAAKNVIQLLPAGTVTYRALSAR